MVETSTSAETLSSLQRAEANAFSHDNVNFAIATKLREYADLLEHQGADDFRQRAYRLAAETAEELDQSLKDKLAAEGQEGLIALPGIGKGIAGAIAEMIATSRWAQLERLRGDLVPQKLFQTIPGIGPVLAERLADEMHLETLEDLETAIHLGKHVMKGLGPRRREAIAAVLAERLGSSVLRSSRSLAPAPPIDLLMQVDSMYRERSASGKLRKIAPKRFNPQGLAWLPIMHARHNNWHFTALFSNTRLAHQLGKTDDWVVIYYEAEGFPEGRHTIVTETRGPLKGQRVVRGRETESAPKDAPS